MQIFYRSLSFVFFACLLVSCTEKKEPTFSIQGSISPILENYILLRQEVDIERKISTIVDTVYINPNGKFKGNFYLDPHLYKLEINDSVDVPLAISKADDITINISELDKKDFKVGLSGSKDAEILLAYETFREKSLDTLVKSVRRQIKELKKDEYPDQAKIDSLGVLEVENYNLHLAELNTYIKNSMGSTLGLYATSIRWKGPENFDFYDNLVTAFETTHPNLEITSKLREKVTRLQQSTVGGTVTDISMNTPDGTSINLFSKHKKYTLVDFWASWCGPCRRESESLNEVYSTYKDQGFEIFGVSLDDDRDKWLKALEKDKRIWPNVSSLERFKTASAFDYAVTALPDNFLIDTDRKIIARNIHGEDLEKLLQDLVGKK